MNEGKPEFLGLIKKKGNAYCLSPERFLPMEVVRLIPYDLLKKNILGYVAVEGYYWLICYEGDGKYIRVPFAKNRLWWDALLAEPEFEAIGSLPQIFITGIA